MVYISNPFLILVLALLWSMDAWLWLALIRLALHRTRSGPASEISQVIASVTDPVTRLAGRGIRRFTQKPAPPWLLWIVTFLAVATARQLLLSLLISHQP
jgi:uncharacterized protein YggT (Ycf19 family)